MESLHYTYCCRVQGEGRDLVDLEAARLEEGFLAEVGQLDTFSDVLSESLLRVECKAPPAEHGALCPDGPAAASVAEAWLEVEEGETVEALECWGEAAPPAEARWLRAGEEVGEAGRLPFPDPVARSRQGPVTPSSGSRPVSTPVGWGTPMASRRPP
jgi:hypothetical protein